MAAPSLTKSIEKEKEKDRIGLRLYNTIAIFDVYVVAHSPEAAREALKAAVASSEQPSELVAKEVTMGNSIRSSWCEEKPFVAADVTDEEFESLRGSTTQQTYERLYTKVTKK